MNCETKQQDNNLSSSRYKARFAPSPTGYMHLGNARTALMSFLLSQHYQGKFVLRIEDTDAARSKDEFSEKIKEDLLWLNINWDEGPAINNQEKNQYYQSQRYQIYEQYYQQLLEKKAIYPCFCSEEKLQTARKAQLSAGKPPRYDGHCLNLTQEQRQQKREQGIPAALRVRVPGQQTIVFQDFIRGEQNFCSDDIGDFIIRRSDHSPAFIYCSVLDDALMSVTHALRGEDHLTNTVRQLLLLQLLELPAPQYGHLPLIMGDDGAPLSKRNGSQSIIQLRERGFLPIAVVNYLARLGHWLEANDLMTIKQLADCFDVEHFNQSPARFDPQQLLFWQKSAIQSLSDTDFWLWLGNEVHQSVPKNKQMDFVQTIRGNIVFPHEALEWAKLLLTEQLEYSPEQLALFNQAPNGFFLETAKAISSLGCDFTQVAQHLKERFNIKGKALFAPLRVALTGQESGPEMKQIFILLGKETLVRRFNEIGNILC